MNGGDKTVRKLFELRYYKPQHTMDKSIIYSFNALNFSINTWAG